MKKVVIWGIGADYERLINLIRFEILKSNIQVVALVAKRCDIVCNHFDGFKIISKEELAEYMYDYIIVTSTRYFEEILSETNAMGIERNKIISGHILNIPNFDFERYVKLIENPVTILSNDCWGGEIYHQLGLCMTSPLINILTYDDSFIKFAQDPVYYLSQPLVMEREGDFRNNLAPVGSLGLGDRKVLLNFVHSPNFEDAEKLWNRRKKRVNYNNLFIKAGFNVSERSEEYLEILDQVPYNKVCFYSGETDKQFVLYLQRFEWYVYRQKRGYVIHLGFNDFCRIFTHFGKSVDLLKMLNGEKDYLREQ